MPSVPLIEHRCLRCSLAEAYEKKIAAGLSSLFSKFKRALRKPASLLVVSSHKLLLHRRNRDSWPTDLKICVDPLTNVSIVSILIPIPNFQLKTKIGLECLMKEWWWKFNRIFDKYRSIYQSIFIEMELEIELEDLLDLVGEFVFDFTRTIMFHPSRIPEAFHRIIMQSHNSRHFYANAIGIVRVKSSARSLVNGAKRNNAFLPVLIDFVGNLWLRLASPFVNRILNTRIERRRESISRRRFTE